VPAFVGVLVVLVVVCVLDDKIWCSSVCT